MRAGSSAHVTLAKLMARNVPWISRIPACCGTTGFSSTQWAPTCNGLPHAMDSPTQWAPTCNGLELHTMGSPMQWAPTLHDLRRRRSGWRRLRAGRVQMQW